MGRAISRGPHVSFVTYTRWHEVGGELARPGGPRSPCGSDDLRMRVSRHARNTLRGRGWPASAIAQVIASEDGWISRDDRGNIMVVGCVSGQRATVVLANDALNFVITI